jgi:TM2 domain-containing membrane protein YozV
LVVTGTVGYGADPLSGQPYSAKSKVTAGVLQLLPGFLFGLGGIGRLYAGNTVVGVLQLVATLVGWTAFWCGFLLVHTTKVDHAGRETCGPLAVVARFRVARVGSTGHNWRHRGTSFLDGCPRRRTLLGSEIR